MRVSGCLDDGLILELTKAIEDYKIKVKCRATRETDTNYRHEDYRASSAGM